MSIHVFLAQKVLVKFVRLKKISFFLLLHTFTGNFVLLMGESMVDVHI